MHSIITHIYRDVSTDINEQEEKKLYLLRLCIVCVVE